MPMRLALEDAFDRITLTERHDRFLPIRTTTGRLPDATNLAALIRRPDVHHFDAKQLLDRLADRRLRCIRSNLEVVLALFLPSDRRLLGHDRTHDGAIESGHGLLPLLLGSGRLGRA